MKSLSKSSSIRSQSHLKNISSTRCLVCEDDPPNDAHHLRGSEVSGIGQKVGDNYTVPLCRICHTLLHSIGDKTFWRNNCIDPMPEAERLWVKTLKEKEKEKE